MNSICNKVIACTEKFDKLCWILDFFPFSWTLTKPFAFEVQSFEELTEFSLVFFRQFTCRLFQSESVDLARCRASLACAGSGPISYDWLWNKNNIIIKAKIVKVKQWTTFGEEDEGGDAGSEGIVGQCKSLSSRKLVNYLKLCLCIGKNCIEWNTPNKVPPRPKGCPGVFSITCLPFASKLRWGI